MSLEAPKVTDLFGDVKPVKAAELHEQFIGELNKSFANASTTPGLAPAADPVAQMQALVANKSLSPDAVSALNNALSAQTQMNADIVKDISLTSPLSTSFAAFDLEAPAKLLTPRPTPLRNKLPRKKGVGTSHRIKRLTGYTGTGTGGQGNIWPGITETTTTSFGSIAYERGPKISYSAEDAIFPYFSYSLSDSVSFDAQFSGVGFQDLRQLSSTSVLYATMLMEERMLLMGRGTDSNFSGALAAPTITATARTAATGETPISSGTKVWVKATSDAGSFGESVVSSVASATPDGSTQVIDVVISAPVTGALGYKVYAGAAGTEPTDANKFYNGRSATRTITLQGTLAVTGDTAANHASDTSAYATGYDGILATVLGAKSGYNNNINAQFSTSNPGNEYQTVFYNLYNNVKADPDEIFLNGSDRKQLSDAIKNGSTANYRLNLTQTDAGDYIGGATIGALYNEITGKMVDLTVHPWLPQGVAPVLSYTLPIPDTQVSNVWEVVNVQDYAGYQWPVVDFQYAFSTYFRGTFMCAAPSWNGAVSGIKAV